MLMYLPKGPAEEMTMENADMPVYQVRSDDEQIYRPYNCSECRRKLPGTYVVVITRASVFFVMLR